MRLALPTTVAAAALVSHGERRQVVHLEGHGVVRLDVGGRGADVEAQGICIFIVEINFDTQMATRWPQDGLKIA